MLELKAVADRVGLSEHQVRRLLRALDPVLQGLSKRGRDNRILLEDGAVAILDRAVALWRGGLPLRDLSQTVGQEMGGGPTDGRNGFVPNRDEPVPHHCPAYEARQELVRELKTDKDRLLAMLEDRDQQILALMPGPSEPRSNGKENGLSRWRALRFALLGR